MNSIIKYQPKPVRHFIFGFGKTHIFFCSNALTLATIDI